MTDDERRLLYRYAMVRLNREIEASPHGHAIKLARMLGISGPHLRHVRTGKDVLGRERLETLYGHWGVSARALLAEAKAHFAVFAGALPARTPDEDRYPARARALLQLLGERELPAGLVPHIESLRVRGGEAWPLTAWLKLAIDLIPLFEHGPLEFDAPPPGPAAANGTCGAPTSRKRPKPKG
jgi:hypothetical protein